jgi:23S rRNA (pseudouridine1915-N3)-methyltransferase
VKVTVIAVGRVRDPLRDAVEEYETRASRYWKLEVLEVDAGAKGAKPDAEQVMAAEEQRILAKLPAGSELVALTRVGERIGSAELARYLDQLGIRSTPSVAFAIGGAYGLGAGVLTRARRRFSLSDMTFPHELARLVLAEQLYRAGTILKGEPYHKGVPL